MESIRWISCSCSSCSIGRSIQIICNLEVAHSCLYQPGSEVHIDQSLPSARHAIVSATSIRFHVSENKFPHDHPTNQNHWSSQTLYSTFYQEPNHKLPLSKENKPNTHTLLLWRNNLLFCCGQLLFKQIILRKTNKNEWEHNASASAYCKVNKLLIEFYEMIFRFVLFYCTIFKPEEKMVNIMKKMREKMKGNLCKIKMI